MKPKTKRKMNDIFYTFASQSTNHNIQNVIVFLFLVVVDMESFIAQHHIIVFEIHL